MTHPIAAHVAASLAALFKLSGRGSTVAQAAPAPAHVTLNALNQARKTPPHPATPAYRLRRPASRHVSRHAWPVRADAPGAGTAQSACEHPR